MALKLSLRPQDAVAHMRKALGIQKEGGFIPPREVPLKPEVQSAVLTAASARTSLGKITPEPIGMEVDAGTVTLTAKANPKGLPAKACIITDTSLASGVIVDGNHSRRYIVYLGGDSKTMPDRYGPFDFMNPIVTRDQQVESALDVAQKGGLDPYLVAKNAQPPPNLQSVVDEWTAEGATQIQSYAAVPLTLGGTKLYANIAETEGGDLVAVAVDNDLYTGVAGPKGTQWRVTANLNATQPETGAA